MRAAAARAFGAFDVYLEVVDAAIGAAGLVENDLALCLELAGDVAAEGAERGRARGAWERARAQWEALGRADRAAAVAAKARGAPTP